MARRYDLETVAISGALDDRLSLGLEGVDRRDAGELSKPFDHGALRAWREVPEDFTRYAIVIVVEVVGIVGILLIDLLCFLPGVEVLPVEILVRIPSSDLVVGLLFGGVFVFR